MHVTYMCPSGLSAADMVACRAVCQSQLQLSNAYLTLRNGVGGRADTPLYSVSRIRLTVATLAALGIGSAFFPFFWVEDRSCVSRENMALCVRVLFDDLCLTIGKELPPSLRKLPSF